MEKHPAAAVMFACENSASHTGVHAAGVVVCNDPVHRYCTVDSNGVAQIDKASAEALKLLKNAVDAFDEADEDREVALVNLGHCYRKIGKYEQSVDVLTRALALDAYQPGTYIALAFAHHLAGDPINAVDAYHKALSLRPEDPFAISMLELALEESEPLTLDRLVVAGGDSATTGGDMMGD